MIILNVFPTHLKMIALQCLWPIVMEIPVLVAKVISLLDNAPKYKELQDHSKSDLRSDQDHLLKK